MNLQSLPIVLAIISVMPDKAPQFYFTFLVMFNILSPNHIIIIFSQTGPRADPVRGPRVMSEPL